MYVFVLFVYLSVSVHIDARIFAIRIPTGLFRVRFIKFALLNYNTSERFREWGDICDLDRCFRERDTIVGTSLLKRDRFKYTVVDL